MELSCQLPRPTRRSPTRRHRPPFPCPAPRASPSRPNCIRRDPALLALPHFWLSRPPPVPLPRPQDFYFEAEVDDEGVLQGEVVLELWDEEVTKDQQVGGGCGFNGVCGWSCGTRR